jgi:hypothetical protein
MKPVLTLLMMIWPGVVSPVQAAGKEVATPCGYGGVVQGVRSGR